MIRALEFQDLVALSIDARQPHREEGGLAAAAVKAQHLGAGHVLDDLLSELDRVLGDDEVYLVSHVEWHYNFKSLVDRGANGGIAGDDMQLAFGRAFDAQGIYNHETPKL